MKLLGCIFIIFASIISSYFYEKNLKDNINHTEALYDLIKHIMSHIEFFSTSIGDILKSYPSDNEFIKILVNKKELSDFSFLEDSISNDIKCFFSKLGKGFKKEQLALCEYTLKQLEGTKNKMKLEFAKKTKVFRSLSLFFGIGCVILLV